MDTEELEVLDPLHYSPVDVDGEVLGVQERTKHAPLRGPCVSVADVLLPTLTTWGWPVRKSRIQLQREMFSPIALSLVMSLEGTMVLNAEL